MGNQAEHANQKGLKEALEAAKQEESDALERQRGEVEAESEKTCQHVKRFLDAKVNVLKLRLANETEQFNRSSIEVKHLQEELQIKKDQIAALKQQQDMMNVSLK